MDLVLHDGMTIDDVLRYLFVPALMAAGYGERTIMDWMADFVEQARLTGALNADDDSGVCDVCDSHDEGLAMVCEKCYAKLLTIVGGA